MRPETSDSPLPPSLDEWLRELPASERQALEEAWVLADQGRFEITDADRSRKAEVWSALEQHMDEEESEDMPRPRLRLVRSPASRWVAVAAGIALLIGIGYFFRPMSVTAPRGAFAQVDLPDGSRVQLNSESTITYRAHFLTARSVRLDGEAFFEVAEDEKPFRVETFNARTAVVGTQFNVWSRSDDPEAGTSVVVAQGSVQLQSKNSDDSGVILKAGQQSRVTSRMLRPTAPEVAHLTRRLAWRSGGLAFSDQSFATIFKEIERRYDVEVRASDDILRASFSYYVHDPRSAESVIADLVAAEGMRYRETSQGFEIFRP